MEVIIKGEANEIAALAVGLQGRTIPVDAVTEELVKRLQEAAAGTFQA